MRLSREREGPCAPLTGLRFGSYILQDLLGAGGMREAYRARDTRLGRAVAIKVLSADVASDPERGRGTDGNSSSSKAAT